jgi:hypothetical protein
MQSNDIKYFLDNMFTNQDEFKAINGVNNCLNAQYMLVADVLSEHIELFADVLKEKVKISTKPLQSTNSIKRNKKRRKTSL